VFSVRRSYERGSLSQLRRQVARIDAGRPSQSVKAGTDGPPTDSDPAYLKPESSRQTPAVPTRR
jgi:hypothetical protein